jgi:phage terminase large subunit-like protein
MDPAMDELEKLVTDKKIVHSSNSLLNFQMGNLQARKNSDGDMKPDNEKSPGNISGAVAMLMAISRQLASAVDSGEWAAS